MIPDFALASNTDRLDGDLVGPGASGGSTTEQLVKYVGLGGLGAISLVMMFLMVRKAGARETLPTPEELAGIPPALSGADADLVGEADESAPAMEGLELNDEALRRQQMLRQISDMVTATPDDAAGLMKRWMRVEA
jgi:flagellar biosynthesis/type III secretory pathway M-ring protein FliF/YscJ